MLIKTTATPGAKTKVSLDCPLLFFSKQLFSSFETNMYFSIKVVCDLSALRNDR